MMGLLLELYVNGGLDASHGTSGVIGGSAEEEDILLAATRDGDFQTDFFDGALDEVRILKIARSPREFELQLPPASVEASSGPGRVDLTWQNGGGAAPLREYRIYRGADSV